MILLILIVLLILLLIILWIAYLQYKKRKNPTQIQNLDKNQRLVNEQQSSSMIKSLKIKEKEISKRDSLNSPKISLSPNQPEWNNEELKDDNKFESVAEINMREEPVIDQEQKETANQAIIYNLPQQINQQSNETIPKTFKTKNMLPENLDSTILKREFTQLTVATTVQSTGSRLRSRRKSIDRPHIGVLDNVSAISLDEFWQK